MYVKIVYIILGSLEFVERYNNKFIIFSISCVRVVGGSMWCRKKSVNYYCLFKSNFTRTLREMAINTLHALSNI